MQLRRAWARSSGRPGTCAARRGRGRGRGGTSGRRGRRAHTGSGRGPRSRPRRCGTPVRTRLPRRIASARSRTVSPGTGAAAPIAVVNPSAVSSASTRLRSLVGRTRWILASASSAAAPSVSSPKRRAARRPSTTHDRFVVAQHQGREPVARAHAVAAADAALPLDRDAELLERRDVPAKRAGRRSRAGPASSLPVATGCVCRGLEEREQPGGWRGHTAEVKHT